MLSFDLVSIDVYWSVLPSMYAKFANFKLFLTVRLGDIPSKLCRDLDFWVHSYISRGKPPDGDLLYEILLYKLIFGHLLNKTS